MSEDTNSELGDLLSQLNALRERLQILLGQQQRIGSLTPAHIIMDINQCREQIRHIKEELRDRYNYKIADVFGEEEAFKAAPEYFDRAAQVLVTKETAKFIDNIINNSGYYIVDSAEGVGKTVFAQKLIDISKRRNCAVIYYLFEGKHNIFDAIALIYQQASDIAKDASRISGSIPFALQFMYRDIDSKYKNLIFIIESYHDIDIHNRWMIFNIIPRISKNESYNISVVFTVRTKIRTDLINDFNTYIANEFHSFTISNFREQDVCKILGLSDRLKNKIIARHIFKKTKGFPLAVNLFQRFAISNESNIEKILSDTPNMSTLDEYYAYYLSRLKESCADYWDIADYIVPFISISLFDISVFDMSVLLNNDISNVYEVIKIFSSLSYDGIEKSSPFWRRSFREYIQKHVYYRFIIQKLNDNIIENRKSLIEKQKYEIEKLLLPYEHFCSVDHLSNHVNLSEVFIKSSWWENIYDHNKSFSDRRDIVLYLWQEIIQDRSFKDYNKKIINIISCAIMATSLNAMLQPELVIELTKRGLWGHNQAINYALRYISSDDTIFVRDNLVGLSDNTLLLKIPAYLEPALEDLEIIRSVMHDPEKREYAINQWISRWKRLYSSDPVIEKEKLQGLLSVLPEKISDAQENDFDSDQTKSNFSPLMETQVDNQNDTASSKSLADLIKHLMQYKMPIADHDVFGKRSELSPVVLVAGPIDGLDFSELLINISTEWERHSRWEFLSLNILSTILSSLIYYSRADMLYALELLAPALQYHFPNAISEMRRAIERIVKNYR